MDDFDALVAMQQRCFPGMQPWGREQIESQLADLSRRAALRRVRRAAGRVVEQPDRRLRPRARSGTTGRPSPTAATSATTTPKGDTLYGIEIMVDPEFRGMKLSRRLYDARKELCRERNLARIIIGGRIPGYGKHADEMTAREYVEQVIGEGDLRSGADGAAGQRLRAPGPDPQLLAVRRRLARLRDVPGVEQPRLRARAPSGASTTRSSRSASASCSTRCGRSTGFDEFAQQCEFFVDTASDYKCDFVLFPELFTTQLLSCVEATRPGQAARQLAEFTPQYLEFFTELAVKYNVNVDRRLAVRRRGRHALQRRLPVPPRRLDRQAVQDPHHAQRAEVVGRQRRATRSRCSTPTAAGSRS